MAAGFNTAGQNQQVMLGFPSGGRQSGGNQPLNRDIIFEEQENTLQERDSKGYLPPLQQKSSKHGIQAFPGGNPAQQKASNRGGPSGYNKNAYLNENSSSVTPETVLAGEQARLGAMLSKMPPSNIFYR